MYILINGSQKTKISNSRYFLDYVSNYLDDYNTYDLINHNFTDIISSINKSDTIILAFPLYVDSPNSLTLQLLDYIYDNNIDLANKNLYVIINCGFREGTHNITALNIIKNWAKKININYKGAILIGAGEIVGKKKYNYITSIATNKLKKFSKCIKDNQTTKDIITTMDLLTNRLYIMFANKSWTKQGKKNNLSKTELKIQ